jgi:hypothetical protein
MFPSKSMTKIPIPTFIKSSEKLGVGILVIDFQGNILVSSDRFQNLLNKFFFNSKRHSALYDLPFQSYVDKPTYLLKQSFFVITYESKSSKCIGQPIDFIPF